MYGIKPASAAAEEAALGTQSKMDIADAVAAELEELKAEPKKSKAGYTFLPVKSGIECVFFMKTRAPVDPAALVDRICDDALACKDVMEGRKLRHINRLTPVVALGKALDRGIEKIGREVLGGVLELKAEEGDAVEENAEIPAHTVRAWRSGEFFCVVCANGREFSTPSGRASGRPRSRGTRLLTASRPSSVRSTRSTSEALKRLS